MSGESKPLKAPNSVNELKRRITRISGAQPIVRVQNLVGDIVVGQMMPSGAIKGGVAIKLRVGDATSRFTTDLDAARRGTLEEFIDQFQDRLISGWEGFAGIVQVRPPAQPADVPSHYVMQPFAVKLTYKGKSFRTVDFELGHDELEAAADPEYMIDESSRQMFADLGLADPQPIPLLPLSYQIAQKLHACTAPGRNERAHDLVDLQILERAAHLDLVAIRAIALRLFPYRSTHTWPPTVDMHNGWDTIYDSAADGLNVFSDIGTAIQWANDLIAQIDDADGSTIHETGEDGT